MKKLLVVCFATLFLASCFAGINKKTEGEKSETTGTKTTEETTKTGSTTSTGKVEKTK